MEDGCMMKENIFHFYANLFRNGTFNLLNITDELSLRKTCLLAINIGCSHHVQNIMFSFFIHQLQLLC